jgi:hypothetical protein
MKYQKTKKLYYGKYPYKVEALVKNIYLIRVLGLASTKKYCDPTSVMEIHKRYDISVHARAKLLKFINDSGDILNDKSIKVRCEGSYIMFYSADNDTHQKIITAISSWITEITEPTGNEELIKLFEKKHIKLCNKLPGGKFQYRVYLNQLMPVDDRLKMYNWLINYEDSIDIPYYTKEWFQGIKRWRTYITFDIENDKSLAFIQLYLGKNLLKTEHYIVRSTLINSVSEDDICHQ